MNGYEEDLREDWVFKALRVNAVETELKDLKKSCDKIRELINRRIFDVPKKKGRLEKLHNIELELIEEIKKRKIQLLQGPF